MTLYFLHTHLVSFPALHTLSGALSVESDWQRGLRGQEVSVLIETENHMSRHTRK